jgi:flavorubredoxin
MYIIVKHIKTDHNTTLPVVLVYTQCEVLEFETIEEAENMKNLFETNSDSGYKYEVKKI